jgi:hypothetical protein
MKIKLFMWLAYQDRVQSGVALKRMKWKGHNNCGMCRHPETSNHIFYGCYIARLTWIGLGEVFGWDRPPTNLQDFHDNWMPLGGVLWGKPQPSHTNNERGLKLENQKPKCKAKGQTKASFSTVDFSKVDPLYKCRSVSFYREAGGLFTFREHPRVKRIKTECARLSSGNLQLGLHVIGAS